MCFGLLAGCGAKEPQGSGNKETEVLKQELTGEWSQITNDGTPSLPDIGIPSGYVFYLDGTGVDTFWNMTFTYTIDAEKLHISYDEKIAEACDYSYSIEGDTLTLTREGDDAVTMIYQKVKEEESESAKEKP